ncbi:efflux RND transporter periplasmic adaptor subunit [Kordiimonas aquimaris]|uniref:efflux RND transporter periplasmic adaptor subunit n=1 Tax=Kordiimonas aquimaris TaxID=707591 RepID=UPI0021D2BC7F|nr:efflux RND transporter periplasmic adaptor subunit [Kordiimonas aquimaris]
MNKSLKFSLTLFASGLALNAGSIELGYMNSPVYAAEQEDHGEENVVEMTAAQRRANGVVTALVARQKLVETIDAPGEVTLNQYATSQVTPRITAQVVARHVRMGDTVRKGQPIITLTSVEMAEAQGELILAENEWKRTSRLGRDVVSEQRFIEAQVAAQQARAKVLAYGMTENGLVKFSKNGSALAAIGQFDLVAPQDGTIINDNFIVGQFIEPGDLLFEVSDERKIWVEAKLSPDKASNIEIGSLAWISEDGNRTAGQVVQVFHQVDEVTRTLAVRVQVDNEADDFHPGEFVDVAISTGESVPTIAVPNQAIVLMAGKQVVFKVEGNELHPTPIVVGATLGDWTSVLSGVSLDDEIVIKNAFLVKSLILKSEMGEGHGH